MVKQYIGSQEHWEDNINADYDERERRDKEEQDDRVQVDDRPKQCYKTHKECKYNCQGLCQDAY
jgi:hypothetical protein